MLRDPTRTNVVIIRHAEADWRPDDSQGLSARGRADAERLAGVLAHLPIVAVYSSPYPRARETVEPLARSLRLQVTIHPDLRERLLSVTPLTDFRTELHRMWENPGERLTGGESNDEAQARGMAALRGIVRQHAGAHVAVASHGNLIALMLQTFDPSLGFEFWERMTMPDVYLLTTDGVTAGAMRRLWPG